jgi:hypothetical protein
VKISSTKFYDMAPESLHWEARLLLCDYDGNNFGQRIPFSYEEIEGLKKKSAIECLKYFSVKLQNALDDLTETIEDSLLESQKN